MVAGGAAFATPFGYQSNVNVYRLGNNSYMDCARVGIPLNLPTSVVEVIAIQATSPFLTRRHEPRAAS
jgi:di/tricarboxylate transporter